ncbi:hypothetical protein AX769_08245 [Frondihabitans sp. PAMC 28766]|uniref:CPBP family intramembrane glutamic endopeptidase n=1 Tax=Frondihabitans sp. PAMC 28766 TaxID=1795630 RepID=UPI00078BC0D1|nr:type II CAAX endopeptidase family protein [Frondihabitans sp. PAMC 28766]AMM20157.1 hypothetical protein AX769_08245 [Frondihabitans sp. PAMC 28766]
MTRISTTRQPDRSRPGIREAAIGLAVFTLVAYGVPPLLRDAGLKTGDPVGYGLALGALSGVAGIVAFLAAMSIRVRGLTPFGVRWPGWRWMFIGVGGGAVVWVLARILVTLFTLIFGAQENVQATYDTAAQGGTIALILSTLFLGVLTPIGEEILFRGVVANVLLRWGWIAGVLGSTIIFAVFHGLTGFNIAMITAFVEGFIAAELFRRTGSIWPGVIVHIVNNAIGNILIGALT